MTTPIPTIAPLPPAPSRANPDDFAAKGDAMFDHLANNLEPQLNASIAAINSTASAVEVKVLEATESANTATDKAAESLLNKDTTDALKADVVQLKAEITAIKDDAIESTTAIKNDAENAKLSVQNALYDALIYKDEAFSSKESAALYAAAAAQSAQHAANVVSQGVLNDDETSTEQTWSSSKINTVLTEQNDAIDTAITNMQTQVNTALNSAMALIYAGL